ncbi:hypothetical protein B0H21DRAFT_423760 [Amylocystis lapponica]|nr:hypothetical protein B0H21DRAFT_423760 [Amylocystis lapponica]
MRVDMSFVQCSEYCRDSVTAYLRVAALAIAAYDWAWTLPVELEMYSEQESIFHLGRACVLFILIRYTSIATLIAGNVGYFKSNWSLTACEHYLHLPSVLKTIQMAVAQVILFIRTWAISRRSMWVFWGLLTFMIISVTVELWSSIYKRVPSQDQYMNCTSGNEPGSKVSWIFYLMSTLFDLLCLFTAIYYLYIQSSAKGMHSISRKLLKEGMLYFIVLQTINVANLIIYLKGSLEAESAAASLGYTLTWIMAQRILIQLHHLRGTTSRSRSQSGGLGEPSRTHHGIKYPARSLTQRMTSTNGTQGDVELSGVHVSVHVEEHHERIESQWDAASSERDVGKMGLDGVKREEALGQAQSARVVFP